MDHTYTVTFEHKEHFTQVEFSKVYGSNVTDALGLAQQHLARESEWTCISVERVD